MSTNQSVTTENKMGVMPENRLLITMALPMMISMLVQALYNIVDSIFVAKICEDALTAVSMAFPMQNLLIGLGTGLGVGINALLSKSLGEKHFDKANQVAMHGIFLALCSYILFLIIGLTTSRIFFVVQDASPTITKYGHTYLSIVLCFSFGIFGQIIFERLLQATGRTFYAMITQGTGAIINILLDPVLIFGLFGFPKLGIAGAAIATVIGQVVAAILAVLFNLYGNKEIHISLKEFHLIPALIGKILYIGIPSVIMVVIGSVMTFSLNKILMVFSSTAVAVFGVYYKLQSFAFMPVFGLNNGMVPIIAYNYGARKPERMMKTLKLSIVYAVSIMLIALASIEIFPKQLLSMFDASESMMLIGVPALRIIAIHFVFAGICVITSSFFQAVGNAIYSTIVSFFRQLVFLVPLAYLFSKTGDVSKVWLAWPIAEIASLCCCMFFMNKINQKIMKPLRKNSASAN